MIWPCTRGAMPIRLARATASSVRGCCSVMFQTRSAKAIAPKITTMLKIPPTILRQPSAGGDFFSGAAAGLGCALSEGGVEGSLIGISIFKKHQPNGQGEDNHQARINEGFRPQMRMQSQTQQQQPDDERQAEAHNNTHHPRRKIRAENIDGWRMSALVATTS